MNYEIQKGYSKPTLDAESFQRLLGAAYILQSRSDRPPGQPIIVADTNTFAASAIVQKRTPSIRLSPTQSGAMREANTVPKLNGLMLWKRVEAFAIAVVFCTMMGTSIHHLLAFPGRTSLPSEILKPQDASRLVKSAPQVLASSPLPAATGESRQSHDDEEAAAGGEDLVIQYRAPTANLPGQAAKEITSRTAQAQSLAPKNTTSESGVRTAIGQEPEMLADNVVQYGDDVTMWSGPSKKSVLRRQGH